MKRGGCTTSDPSTSLPILYINSLRACVCLTRHSAPIICEADSATPLCVRSSVHPSIRPSVRLFVRPSIRSSVRSSVCPEVFFSPSLKLTKMKKQKKKSLKVRSSVCPEVFFSPFLKLTKMKKQKKKSLKVHSSVCPDVFFSLSLKLTKMKNKRKNFLKSGSVTEGRPDSRISTVYDGAREGQHGAGS